MGNGPHILTERLTRILSQWEGRLKSDLPLSTENALRCGQFLQACTNLLEKHPNELQLFQPRICSLEELLATRILQSPLSSALADELTRAHLELQKLEQKTSALKELFRRIARATRQRRFQGSEGKLSISMTTRRDLPAQGSPLRTRLENFLRRHAVWERVNTVSKGPLLAGMRQGLFTKDELQILQRLLPAVSASSVTIRPFPSGKAPASGTSCSHKTTFCEGCRIPFCPECNTCDVCLNTECPECNEGCECRCETCHEKIAQGCSVCEAGEICECTHADCGEQVCEHCQEEHAESCHLCCEQDDENENGWGYEYHDGEWVEEEDND